MIEMNTNTRRSISAAALALVAAATLSACSLGSGVPADQVVPSAGSASGSGGSLATATASPTPIEDRTDLETGVIDGFAAWGVDRNAVDMSAVSAVFGEEVTEAAVSTALVRLMEGYSGDSLMVAHDLSLEAVAAAALSEHATADFMATYETVAQALNPATSAEGTFTTEDGKVFTFESWDCAMNTIPTAAVNAADEIEVRAVIECALTTTEGTDFEYVSDVALRMIPSGDAALINSVGFTTTLEAK